MEVGNLYVKLGIDDSEFRTKLANAQQLLAHFNQGFLTELGTVSLGETSASELGNSSLLATELHNSGTTLAKVMIAGLESALKEGFGEVTTLATTELQAMVPPLMSESGEFIAVGEALMGAVRQGVMAKTNEMIAQVMHAVQKALQQANTLLSKASVNVNNGSRGGTTTSSSLGATSTLIGSSAGGMNEELSASKKSKVVTQNTTVNFDFKDTSLTPETLKHTLGLLYEINPTEV